MPDPKNSSGGRPLDPAIRQKMEAAFGQDLSKVRIHTKTGTPSLGARAFTQGEHVFFQAGAYAPHCPSGEKLLTHELAHVLQQRAPGVKKSPEEDPATARKVKELTERALKKL